MLSTPRIFVTIVSMAAAIACAPKGGRNAIASPDPHAPRTATASTTDDAPAAKRDVASVCAASNAIADAGARPTSYADGTPAGATAFVFGAPKSNGGYSMAELQALEKKGQHLELLQHIEDISPTGRGATWDALLERVATAVVGSLATEGDTYRAFEAMHTAEHLASRYPQLAKSKSFMAKRGEAGRHMFSKCFAHTYTGEECVSMALDFVRLPGTDAATKLAVAKIVGSNQNPYVAVPFFRTAIDDDRGACKDAAFETAATAGLGLPPDYPVAKTSRDLAQNVCFAELRAPIVEKLTGTDGGGYFADNACAVLRAKGEVK
jgi:hypothetical protein